MKIAIYVQGGYDRKRGWQVSSRTYDFLGFAGVEMVKDALEREGFEVGYCGAATVDQVDIVLVSIISETDWYSFIAERVKWPKGDYKVVIGGHIDNIRPFLEYADAFVFGRGEDVIVPLVQCLLVDTEYTHPSIAYSKSFSIDKRYKVAQATQLYPHTIDARKKGWCEGAIGCKRKCMFCKYTWTRRHIGGDEYNALKSETTLFDLDLDNPEGWREDYSFLILGIDGCTERLRRMANKPITDEMIEKLVVQAIHYPSLWKVKLFNIVGYPTETEEDWKHLVSVFVKADAKAKRPKGDTRRKFLFNLINAHFNPEPCTPFAVLPGTYRDLRWAVMDATRISHTGYRHTVFDGKEIALKMMPVTVTLPTVTLWHLAARGVESDAEIIRKIATSAKYAKADTDTRRATLERFVDIDRIFGIYTWDDLPTRFLETYIPYKKLAHLCDTRLREYGGEEGIRIADAIK